MKKTVGETTDLQANQISFEQRAREIAEEEQKEQEARERARKNDNFYMVFKGKGSPLLRRLIGENHVAAQLFMYLSEEMDRTNAVVASGKALASVLGVSEPTVSRAIKHLVENEYVAKFKSGGSNVFVANPDMVWNAWATGKDHCLFNNSKVLISQNEQDATTTKRFNVVMQKRLEMEESGQTETPGKRRVGRPRKARPQPQV